MSTCICVTLTHTDEEWEREREREREIPSMHARLLSKGEPISSSSSNGLSSTDTGLNCSFCLFVHSCYDPYHVHLIIIIKKLLKIIHIASVSTRNATSHSSIPKKKKKKKNQEQSATTHKPLNMAMYLIISTLFDMTYRATSLSMEDWSLISY